MASCAQKKKVSAASAREVVLAAGTTFGALQGLISIRFRLEPFIVTLAGLQMARGLALILSGSLFTVAAYADDIRVSRLRQHGLDAPDDPDLGHPAH